MISEITTMIAAGLFFSAGGKNFLLARREFFPAFVFAQCFYVTHSPWSLTIFLACVFTALGYGDNSPIRHIFGDSWGRGVWSLLVGASLSTWAVLTGHLAWPWYVAYLIGSFFLEPLFKNLYQVAGDFLIGFGLASFILVVHKILPA